MTEIDNEKLDHSTGQQATPTTSRAHPRVYAIFIALTVWFVLAVWSFAGGGVSDYLLFIVSAFLFVAVALMLIMFQVGRRSGNRATQSDDQPPLREWAKWDYETWTGRLNGTHAAEQILLPIAAAALGMTIFGILFHVAGGA